MIELNFYFSIAYYYLCFFNFKYSIGLSHLNLISLKNQGGREIYF